MTFLSGWITVFVVGLIAVVTPGPDFAITLRNSLAYSRRAGVFTAIGIGVGNSIHATYSLIGIGAIISRSILLFNALKWIGAAYLIYIGIQSLRAKKAVASVQPVEQRQDMQRWRAFRIELLANLLNPKATLFFLALFTQIVQPQTPIVAQSIYGATVAVLSFIWFALVAVFISQPAIKDRVLAFSHWIERLTGVVLIALGLRLAVAQSSK